MPTSATHRSTSRTGGLTGVAEALVRASTGRRALVGLALFVVFSAGVLPWQARLAAQYSAGAGSPDSSLWYSPSALYGFAEAYGAEGRASYVLARVTFDVLWPVVYTVMLVLVLGWLLARATRAGSATRLLVLVPVAAMLADYGENLCTAVVMARYPDDTDVLATLAPFFTAAKWGLITTAFLLIPVIGVAALTSRRRAVS